MRKCIKYFCFPWLMIISLGVKKFFNKLQKNFDIPVSQNSLSVGLRLKNRVKLTVKWSMCVCVDLFQSIWDKIKIQGKRTADGSKQIDSWAILREGVRHERARDPLHENCFATDTYTLFLLQERCFSSPGRNILSFLPILGWKYSMTCIIIKL